VYRLAESVNRCVYRTQISAEYEHVDIRNRPSERGHGLLGRSEILFRRNRAHESSLERGFHHTNQQNIIRVMTIKEITPKCWLGD